jgi:hypothetical protein
MVESPQRLGAANMQTVSIRSLAVALVCAVLLCPCQRATAQHFEARLGVLASTVLVRDGGASAGLARALGATVLAPTELKLSPAPAASALMVSALGARTQLELSGMFALSKLRASNDGGDWDVQDVSVATLTIGARYQRWRRFAVSLAAGGTHFFTDDRGIFSAGNGLMPLVELGALARIPAGTLPLHATVRVQSHNFGTPALRREAAGEGKPVRLLVQLGFGG